MSRALSEAQQTVQTTKHFAHPANWAGFLLIGADVKLSNKVAFLVYESVYHLIYLRHDSCPFF